MCLLSEIKSKNTYLEQHGLGEGGLVVDPGAPLAVRAGAHLEEERAVHLVLLRPENARQILGHFFALSTT